MPVAAVDDEGGVVGVDAGGDVGTGVGVDVVPLVPLPPQATSRTASNRLHIASADQRVKCFNRVNIKNFMRYTPKLPIVQFGDASNYISHHPSPWSVEQKSLSL